MGEFTSPTPLTMRNLSIIEELLLQKLKSEIPDLRTIRSTHNINDNTRQPPHYPALYLTRGGHEVEWQSIDEQSIQQKWLFDLVIRSTGDVKRTDDEMAVVGGLLESLCGVLAGWVPMAGCSPLRLVGSKGGEVREGEVHYGLLFAMRMVVTG